MVNYLVTLHSLQHDYYSLQNHFTNTIKTCISLKEPLNFKLILLGYMSEEFYLEKKNLIKKFQKKINLYKIMYLTKLNYIITYH